MTTGDLTILNAVLLDVETGELEESSLRIVNGRITRDSDAAPTDGEVIDARGRVVSPGLIDAHFHAYAVGIDSAPGSTWPMSYVALAGARRLRRALERGFTTVRDPAGGDLGLRRAIREGLIPAPTYYFSGSALSQTGGHGDYRDPEDVYAIHAGRGSQLVDGVDAVLAAVRERFRTGASFIKMMTSGGVVSLTDPLRNPQFSPEEIAAASAEAGRRGSYVTAHCYSPEGIAHSVGNGIHCIEHGNLLDAPSAELMAQRGAYLVPTLAAYDAMTRQGAELGLGEVFQQKNREVFSAGMASVEIARAAGVRTGFGSDLMGPLETNQLRGIALQSEAIGILETLRSATVVNAELLPGVSGLASLADGALGDIVVWDGNPLDDPSVVYDPARERIVVKAGVRVT